MNIDGFQSDSLKFASLIAHQLQSPLNAVAQSLRSVLGEYAGPLLPSQRGSLEQANARCDQAIQAVQRMLAILKASQGADEPVTPAPLVGVVRQLQAQYASEAARLGIALDADTHADTVYVRMGEPALAEVLSALISNALKYTPENGRIRLSTAAADIPGFVRLGVADSGVGVPEGDRERIFQPFHRSKASRASALPGVGLGLAFVRSMVLAAGGSIRVEQSDLGGAGFTITLPEVEWPDMPPAAARTAPALRVVIVGGVTAGPKAAAKIIRLRPDADVTVIDRGSAMSYAGCGLPYYVSGVVRDQRQLISTYGVIRDFVFFRNVKNVHVMNQTEALAVDRPGRRVRVRDASSGREAWLPYDKLLLATGSSAALPAPLRTSLRNVFTLHGVRDAEGIRTAMAGAKAKDVVIVGGGLLGIEMTEALVRKGARVTIVEQRAHILSHVDADIAILVERHLEENGVRVLTGTAAAGFIDNGDGAVGAVRCSDGDLPANLVILALGVRPNTELALGCGLPIGPTGAIAVDEALRTADPDIFAAGDCAETTHLVTGRPYYMPLGSTATKQGRVAAVNMCGGADTFPGVMGTSICKVFDYTVARTGLSEREAREQGYDAMGVLCPGPDRAHFMPNARPLLLKLVVDRKTRTVLGAMATGPGVADKRIDVASVAVSARLTVDALAKVDLGYNPPYSQAQDNLITAANVARNKLDGDLRGISPLEVKQLIDRRADIVLLDVRTPAEFEQVRLPNSMLIPLGALRSRLAELPRDRDIVAYCDISLRGYEASLILRAAGFERVQVMEGGLAMWPFETVA